MTQKTLPKNKGKTIPNRHEEIEDAEIVSETSPEWDPDQEAEEQADQADPSNSDESTALAPLSDSELPVPIYNRDAQSISDPLRQYMEEVRRYPLLSAEEELKLATRLRETGDIEAAKTLVSANLRLVVKIAFEYRSIYSNILDLIQEGNIGLMKAVSKYDLTKGARLGYYSSWWIKSYILKYLLDNFRLVKIGTTQAQKKLFYHLMREKERIEAQGLLAGPKLLAERLDVREKDVVEMEQRLSGSGAELSLDTPIQPHDESPTTHGQLLPDQSESADEVLARNQLLQMLSDQIPAFKKTLKDKELKILETRILSETPKTLQEVADEYQLTRERVRQIEAKVIAKLREFFSDQLRPQVKIKGRGKTQNKRKARPPA